MIEYDVRERRSHSDVKRKGRTIRRREEEVETQAAYVYQRKKK
eukprot:COSAG06_NODE_2310_length_7103_cov_30.593232_6_plen_43_part_00